MKKAALLAFALFSAAAFAAPVPARRALSSAEAKAQREHKNVFVIFHASWCGWCHKLEALLASPEFKPVFDRNYVFVTVDVLEQPAKKELESPGGAELSTELGADQQGLPFFVVLDPKGKKLMDSMASGPNGKPANIGYPSEPGEVTYFMKLLHDTAPKLKTAEADKLQAFLSKKA